MSTSDKWAPRVSGIRLPSDSKKKNGMFWNWPRFLYFGGTPGADQQSGSKGPTMKAGENSVGPVSDRGKGR